MDLSKEDLEKLPLELRAPILISQVIRFATESVVAIQCILHLCPERKDEVLKHLISDYSIVSKSFPKLKETLNTITADETNEQNQQDAMNKFMRDLVLESQSVVEAYLTGHSNEQNQTH